MQYSQAISPQQCGAISSKIESATPSQLLISKQSSTRFSTAQITMRWVGMPRRLPNGCRSRQDHRRHQKQVLRLGPSAWSDRDFVDLEFHHYLLLDNIVSKCK